MQTAHRARRTSSRSSCAKSQTRAALLARIHKTAVYLTCTPTPKALAPDAFARARMRSDAHLTCVLPSTLYARLLSRCAVGSRRERVPDTSVFDYAVTTGAESSIQYRTEGRARTSPQSLRPRIEIRGEASPTLDVAS